MREEEEEAEERERKRGGVKREGEKGKERTHTH